MSDITAVLSVRDFMQGSDRPATTVSEIADGAGVCVVHQLEILGATRRHPALSVEADDVPTRVRLPSQVALVLVRGWIEAGPLNLSDRALDRAFLVDRPSIGNGTFFMYKVQGDSMINAGIADGNWVVVRQDEDARDGEIVVACVDGEATVKTLHRTGDMVELVPENPAFEPIRVTELTILGTVVGVVRQEPDSR